MKTEKELKRALVVCNLITLGKKLNNDTEYLDFLYGMKYGIQYTLNIKNDISQHVHDMIDQEMERYLEQMPAEQFDELVEISAKDE